MRMRNDVPKAIWEHELNSWFISQEEALTSELWLDEEGVGHDYTYLKRTKAMLRHGIGKPIEYRSTQSRRGEYGYEAVTDRGILVVFNSRKQIVTAYPLFLESKALKFECLRKRPEYRIAMIAKMREVYAEFLPAGI